MSENGAKVAYIGGACFSTEVPAGAMAIAETVDGKFLTFGTGNKLKLNNIHIITPLVATGELTHERMGIHYTCEAMPVMVPNMALSKYPKMMTEEMKTKIFDIACMCAPQEFARMHEEPKVIGKQNTNFWGFDYNLIYTFKLANRNMSASLA